MPSALPTERKLTADRLAQYIKRRRCQRFLRFGLFKSEAETLASRYGIQYETLSPLLSESGQSYERETVKELEARGALLVDLQNKPTAEFVRRLERQTAPEVFYYQTKLTEQLGLIECEGVADLILIEKISENALRATIVDIKSSRRETTGYRLQVAFYARLLQKIFEGKGWRLESVRGAIHLRNSVLDPAAIETFDLGLYFDEIERLVEKETSDAARAAQVGFTGAAFHLNDNCDGCPYNAACFVNAAESEDVSLVPGLTAGEKQALIREGYGQLRDVAGLYVYGGREMQPAAKPEAERLNRNWALSGKMPIINQRARAALNRFDKSVEFRPFILGSDFGTLPDTGRYPELIRVFLDTQHDYLNDRLYLFSAVIAGAARTAEVCEITPRPPDDESEAELLIGGIRKVLKSIAEVADSTHAPVHFYLFDARSQSSLKAALTRNFAKLCAIPAFYDLLTSSPALSQPMISFLADDVAARKNLKNLGQNLYQMAGEMGFDWTGEGGGGRNLKERFRARIFDNYRRFEKDAGGSFIPSQSGGTWVEAAARFGTEIPLEYAYAAWGELKNESATTGALKKQLEGFLGTTVDELKDLAALRCRALQHIEESFGYKNRDLEKQELDLRRLHEIELDPEAVPLSRAIEDFLFLEHHARRQEAFLFLALPPDVRAATGRTAILRCEDFAAEEKEPSAEFTFTNLTGEPTTDLEQKMLRFRAGDWVVLNELRNENGKFLTAKSIVRGRLAIIEEVGARTVKLKLSPMCKESSFRYSHRLFKPEVGKIYTIDQMLDDFNSDKFLAACRHAELTNPLYRWLTDPESGQQPRSIRPKRMRDAETIAEMANRAQEPHDLTDAQRKVIGKMLDEKVFVLQGPPGTGKSHTLGFAVLARILALQSPPNRPFRVAISAKTHAAVNIALASISKRAAVLLEKFPDEPLLAPLKNLKVYKICSDAGEALPPGLTPITPDGDEETSAGAQWDKLAREQILVVGGTPGMLYNIIKRGANRGKKEINWAAEYFDLVVVDEASQMGLAEALTAAAFLKGDGQFIAIGDHRQMPPILAHAWDRESRRDLEKIKPHLSIFEFLKESGFRSAALDESFRIPAEIAEFLGRHIYSKDDVEFHSNNRKRLEGIENLNEDWLNAVFAPEHSIVLIEHSETDSAHANDFEAFLVERIAATAAEKLGLDAGKGIGIVVPHRMQKALLQTRLPHLADSVDTVERFQGGERDLIIVSATVSDREFANAEMEFLLDPRRLTVAVSRPKKKLVLIVSQTIFELISGDLDEYEQTALWKCLRRECNENLLWDGYINNHQVRIHTA